MSVSDWDNEYARLARAASQLRTTGIVKQPTDVQALQQGLQNLERTLHTLPLQPGEVQRRRRLIQHLQQTTAGGNHNNNNTQGIHTHTDMSLNNNSNNTNNTNNYGQRQSQMTMALRQQDDMIDELAIGVGRLKTQTAAIGDEARMHVNLINDMDTNLDAAQSSLEDQTRRATRLRQDQSLWKLQLIVAGLFILLILLILMGLTP